jgi:glycosyltransferase involved in cell wall biosynthesis
MRIAILADFPVKRLPGFEGGPTGYHATWLPPLAEGLEKISHGHEIHWICCTKEVTRKTEIKAWGQTFHLLPRKKLSVEILTRFIRERRMIGKCLASLKPDLVHAWGTEQGYALAAADYPARKLLSIQGMLQLLCERERQPWLMRVQARSEKHVLGAFDQITVESDWAAERIKEYAPHARLDKFTYGVAPAWLEVERTPEARPLVVFAGTLSRSKGVDTLLQAFRDSRLHQVRLVLLGDGPLRGESSEQISFAGHVPPEMARLWMSRAWALVHPTRADVCPNCVKEARVAGLPVVTTPEGGQVEWVTNGGSGILHEAGDVEGLILAILKVTESLETSLRMGQHGRQECRAELSPRKAVMRWLEIVGQAT